MTSSKLSPWRAALFHPLHLGMLALSIAAGLCAAWWLSPVGLLLWMGMVLLYQQNRGLRLSLILHNRDALARRLQDRFDRIERTQISLYNSLISAPRRKQKQLQPLQDAMSEAVDRIHRFCLQLSALENYRAVQKNRSNQAEIELLNENIAKALDPRVRAEYEETLQALQRRLDNLERIQVFLDRVDAQLVHLAIAFEDLLSQAISIQASDSTPVEGDVRRLIKLIQEELTQLAQIEKESNELQSLNR